MTGARPRQDAPFPFPRNPLGHFSGAFAGVRVRRTRRVFFGHASPSRLRRRGCEEATLKIPNRIDSFLRLARLPRFRGRDGRPAHAPEERNPPVPLPAAPRLCPFFPWLASGATLVLAVLAASAPTTWSIGGDFSMRYNEMQCVLSGADPYEIAFGGTEATGFRDLNAMDAVRPERLLATRDGKAVVNSYPPWAYTFLFPLHRVPPRKAALLFDTTALACFLFLLFLAFARALREGLPPAGARIAFAVGGFLGLPLLRVLQVSNYGLFLAAAAALLSLALEARRDWLAGFALALLLLKPQLGLPFAVPLLLKGKWKTLLTGTAVCFAASLPPALLVHRNVFSMILHAAHSGTASIHSTWQSTGWFSPPVFRALAARLGGTGGALAASMALGAAVLFAASWRIRRGNDWWMQLVPPAVVACLWSMGHAHDHVLLAPALATVAIAALRQDGSCRFFAVGTALLAGEFWVFAALAGCVAAWSVLHGGGLALSDGLNATRATGPKTAYTAYLQLVSVLQAVWLLRLPRTDGRPAAP